MARRKKLMLVEYSATGKRACNVFHRAFGRKPRGLETDKWRDEDGMYVIEVDRTGRSSSKGPAFYDVLQVWMPVGSSTAALTRRIRQAAGSIRVKRSAMVVTIDEVDRQGFPWCYSHQY